MAKMHSKKRGKSKSRKPVREEGAPASGACKLSRDEIAELAAGYARQGMSQAMIGERLKEEHNVQYIKEATGSRLAKLLSEKGIKPGIPGDMLALMTKAVRVRRHLAANRQDVYSRVRLIRIESKLLRLSRYYRAKGVLPEAWRYDPQQAELIVKGKA